MLLSLAVHDEFLLLVGEVPVRDIGAYSVVPGDVLHERPDKGLPRQHGPIVNGLRFVYQSGLVDLVDDTCSAAFLAGSRAVEC